MAPSRRFLLRALVSAALLSVGTGQSASSSSSSSSSSLSDACSSATTFSTLLASSSACGDVCAQDDTCVVVNTADASLNTSTLSETCSADGAAVGCTEVASNDSSLGIACEFLCLASPQAGTFTVLVATGEYQSKEEQALRAENGDERFDRALVRLEDDSGVYATVSNDLLQSVGALSLDSSIFSFQLSGGKTYDGFIQAHVALIEFGDEFIASQTQVHYVTLSSLDLTNVTSRLPTLLPNTINSLDLDNTLQYEFPTHLEAAFPSLETLTLSWNYIPSINSSVTFDSLTLLSVKGNNLTSFEATLPNLRTLVAHWNLLPGLPPPDQLPSLTGLYMAYNWVREVNDSHSSDKLVYLDLTNNSVSSFTAEYPSLQELYLDNNSLSEIPTSVFKSTSLRILTITGNNLSLTLTTSQFSFLQGLETLNINARNSSSAAFVGCDSIQTLQNVSVCVMNESNGTTVITDTGGKGSNTVAIAGGVAAGVVVVVVIAIYCFIRRRRRLAKQTLTDNTGSSGGTRTGFVTLWSDPQLVALQRDADAIEDIKQLGSGAFGVVWLVRYQGDRLLASKRLLADKVTRARTQDFVNEIKLMARLDHPNIVALYGIAWTHEADLQALTEFVDNGDLRDYLLRSTQSEWTTSKLGIAICIVDALAYVHSFLPPIVHRDLKSRNVLLTSDLTAKITDFGASREQSANMTMTQGVGTGRWQAPEVLSGSQEYDYRADIYSFGVLLAELDSHLLPYEGARGAGGEMLTDIAILHMVAMGQLRPSFSPRCPRRVRALADRCLAQDPKHRPSAVECAYKLRAALKSVAS